MNPNETRLRELIFLFLKLGTTTFGGPAAHIAMMQNEVVKKRAWLSSEEFLDLLSLTNFIPGPNSTEMAIHIGYRRAGLPGLIVSGISFILPAALIVSLLAHFYLQYGNLPSVAQAFYGMKPVIIAIVFLALFALGKTALKNKVLYFILVIAVIANAAGINELIVLAVAGIFNLLIQSPPTIKPISFVGALLLTPKKIGAAIFLGIGLTQFSLGALFTFFLKVGSVLFGSGYVLLAFLRSDLVEKFHWLNDQQLLDAIAVGQFTPGPVFTTATFIGYLLSGPRGAIVATIGIFFPAFFFVALSAPFVSSFRQSTKMRAVLDGVNVASLAIMAVVTAKLGRVALFDAKTISIALISCFLLFRFRVNSIWLILAGAFIGRF